METVPVVLWIVSGYFALLLLALWREATPANQPPTLDRVGPKPWTLHHALMLAGLLLMLLAVRLLVEFGVLSGVDGAADWKKMSSHVQQDIFLSGLIASGIFGLAEN